MASMLDDDDRRPRTFTNSIAICFNRYFQFSGRAIRAEYWYFVLFGFLAGIAADIVDLKLLGARHGIASTLVSLALFIPSLAVGARRPHDIDRSGWWLLLSLIPVIGWLVLFVWAVSRGTPGPNQYGPHPFAAFVAPASSAPAA